MDLFLIMTGKLYVVNLQKSSCTQTITKGRERRMSDCYRAG